MVTDDIIVFPISIDEKIMMKLPCKEIDIYRYDEIEILIQSSVLEHKLYGDDFIIEAISALNNLLEKVIENKLNFHESLIGKEIGYLCNEYYHDENQWLVYEDNVWVGLKHHLWGTKEYDTWLYNMDNKIFIEVTPIYKWHFDELEDENQFITYDQFLHGYKTCYVGEITKETALNWLKKCKKIIQIIKDND
ncbi:hypothetical protein WAZ07_21925 [Bacillus sp. FJAT-51639]|uniref:Uncharacterized protein n=1 Tax=Bacillus bruguierae TaxID=3127667 RepID=A0ABU8FQ72_9BACI